MSNISFALKEAGGGSALKDSRSLKDTGIAGEELAIPVTINLLSKTLTLLRQASIISIQTSQRKTDIRQMPITVNIKLTNKKQDITTFQDPMKINITLLSKKIDIHPETGE